jgi:hypothetical protein
VPFNEALFWVGITVLGTGLYIFWDRHLKSPLWSLVLVVIGLGTVVYSVYIHSQPQALRPPIWLILLIPTWAALGYAIYVRARRGQSLGPTPAGSAAPKKVPEIVGDFSDVKIIRHGLIIDASNGQQWMMVGFSINVYLNSSESVCINDIRLRTHKMSPPCRSLLPLLPPPVSELEANVGHSFRAHPQIEYWYDRTKNLPSSLEMMLMSLKRSTKFI